EVAVLGRPHAEWGEEVVAFVVPRAPCAGDEQRRAFEAALDAHCLQRIARFKRPRAYLLVDELPKNATGKVLKTELRRRCAQP
ncbi:MAG TPA: long-chain fatty acid--CoA ligase, partial [Casimicrobiaceae bacterium]|nr:long-chain fatty acid--CoA ligase [Casimicrobiaceae bacterium]